MSEYVSTRVVFERVEQAASELILFASNGNAPDMVGISQAGKYLNDTLRALSERLDDGFPVPTCATVVGPHTYWRNAEGDLVAVENVRPADQLQDEVVRKLFGYVIPLSERISRFRAHTRKDIGDFVDLVLQQHGTKRGGRIGNVTLTSFDDMFKVALRIAKLTHFDSDLLAVKALTDECLAEWSEDGNANLRTIVRGAFHVDKDGKLNQHALLGLPKHDIADDR